MPVRRIDSIDQLKPGDVIRNRGSGAGYIVTGNYGGYVVAIQQLTVTNPAEWLLVTNEENADALRGTRR